MNKLLKYELTTTCTVLGLTILSGSCLMFSNFVSADTTDAVDTLTITVDDACTLTRSDSGTYSGTISNGAYGTIDGSTFSTTCNDASGYSIYAIGYTDNSEGNTDLINPNLTDDNYHIATGTATSGDTSNWAMKLEVGTDSSTIQNGFTAYSTIPSTYTKVATKTSGTTPSGATTASIKYRVFISQSQPAGSYTGKVKYTLVHPNTACPSGYKMSDGVCTPIFSGISTMQAMTTAICTAATIGDSKSLTDTRDNKTYRVTKLADGNCWMTENLRFGGANASGTAITITSSDSDVTSNFSLTTSTPTGSAYTTSTSWTERNQNNGRGSDKSEYYPDDSIDSDTSMYWGYYYNWYAATAGTGTAEMESGNATSSICPKNWQLPVDSASTADATTKNFVRLLYTTDVINANTSIGSNTNIYYPTNGFTALTSSPLYFLRAGFHNPLGTTINGRGSYYGHYWSATASSTSHAYALYFCDSLVDPRDTNTKTYGFSIRCVAR